MAKIEKGIALPDTHFGRGNQKYPEFREMDVGDSVFFPRESSDGKAACAAKKYGHRSGRRFSSRMVEGGVRIWRVE